MSDMETHLGKLRKVKIETSLEDFCKQKCNEKGIKELPSYHDTWEEQLRYESHQKYFIVGQDVWEAVEHEELDGDNDIDIMKPNEDGTVSFVMRFYNGGTCLNEMIEDGLKKLKT